MKIGIVGGYGHAIVRALPGAEIAWAGDGYDNVALERAAALGCTRTYPSMEAMLTDFQPDIVYIGTVYARNGTLAVQALERGFNVVCEKPLATDVATLQRLRELTASGERHIVAELSTRWNGSFRKARELIGSGAIGEPIFIQAQKSYKFGAKRPEFYKTRELFGGIIPWVATHAIDFAAWTTGLRYETVSATHGNRCFPDYQEMEDHAAMLFTMTGGVPCVITADFLRPEGASSHGDDRLRVTGSKGVVEVRNAVVFLTNADGEQQWELNWKDQDGSRCAEGLAKGALGDLNAGITTEESLHATAAALAAQISADDPTGRRESVAF